MTDVIYFNEHFYPSEAPLFTAKERAFLYGDGFFTSIRLSEGILAHLDLHLERLKKSAEVLNICFSPINEKIIQELIARNHAETGIWKLKIIITGGDSASLVLPQRQGQVLMTLTPYIEIPFKPLFLGLFPEPIMRPFARHKTLAYLDQLAVKQMAIQQGFDDMLILTSHKEILETTVANIFWMDEQTFYTPSPTLPLLYGIGVQTFEKIASKQGWKIQHGAYILEEIPSNASAYLCNALMGFRPVTQIADRTFARNLSIEHFLHNKQYNER
jgi:4-amino-4-deoxychorismate lyase